MIKLTWNYKFKEFDNFNIGTQFDWNQTFITKLNQLRGKVCHTNEQIELQVPTKFKSIIESLYYYNKNDNTISNLYSIKYIDSDIDYIKFSNLGKIKIKNFE